MKTIKKVHIAVVGGGFGTDFYWNEHPDCVVEAVGDPLTERRDRLSNTYRCSKTYASLEEVIRDEAVDAVALFTGAPDHARHAVACLEAGKRVFSAVPAAITLEECERLADAVKRTGQTYMMAETSWYHQSVMTARQWFREGKFGEIYYTEAEYHHPGLDVLFHDKAGNRTWRHGLPPMHYPTHCTGYLLGVTGEKLTQVSCAGWGPDTQMWKDNAYNNSFANETAFFVTDQGHSFRVGIYWDAPVGGCERGEWYGEKMSFFDSSANGGGPVLRRAGNRMETDDAGFARKLPEFEAYEQPKWWQTDMLPEPLRHNSGHDGSHTFLTHEFVDALIHGRQPAIGISEALNLTAPGIIAHQSAMQGGKQLPIPSF